jgi:hypothetical protein
MSREDEPGLAKSVNVLAQMNFRGSESQEDKNKQKVVRMRFPTGGCGSRVDPLFIPGHRISNKPLDAALDSLSADNRSGFDY